MEPVFFQYDVEKTQKRMLKNCPNMAIFGGGGKWSALQLSIKLDPLMQPEKMSKKGANRQLMYSEMSREQQLCSHDRI